MARTDENIIDLLTRYPVRDGSNPRENRLTAALAASLTRADHLARALAKSWHAPAAGRVTVNPQARTRKGRRRTIDLELRFGESRAPSIVWIEAKLYSELSERQLDHYACDLKDVAAEHRLLVLLVPASRRAHFDFEPIAARQGAKGALGPYVATWQEVHACLRAVRRADDWLTEEVLDYMEREGLKGAEALNQARLDALELAELATASLQAIIDGAADELTHRDGRKPVKSTAYERRYKPSPGWGRDTRFVMGVDVPGVSEPTFYAGVQWPADRQPFGRSAKRVGAWEALLGDWDDDRYGQEVWRWRAAPLGELLSLGGLDKQCNRVAKHAAEVFKRLESSRTEVDAGGPAGG